MNINMAEATVKLLVDKGLVKDAGDLYSIRAEDLVGLERFAHKSSLNLVKSIENSKNLPWHRLLYALGIRFVGETVARKLAEAFSSVEKLMNADRTDLLAVDEVGEKIADSIIGYFSLESNQVLIRKLMESGVNTEKLPDEGTSAANEKLDGKRFVISGSFRRHSRDQLKTLIEQNGGISVSSVSSNVDYIIGGENIGPSKFQKARELDIPVISEEDFAKMINL